MFLIYLRDSHAYAPIPSMRTVDGHRYTFATTQSVLTILSSITSDCLRRPTCNRMKASCTPVSSDMRIQACSPLSEVRNPPRVARWTPMRPPGPTGRTSGLSDSPRRVHQSACGRCPRPLDASPNKRTRSVRHEASRQRVFRRWCDVHWESIRSQQWRAQAIISDQQVIPRGTSNRRTRERRPRVVHQIRAKNAYLYYLLRALPLYHLRT
jgi:hypothetical protein